MMTKIWNLKNK